MAKNILSDVKKMLNIPEEMKAFDQDLIVHINSVLAIVKQLGVRAEPSFMLIEGDETWDMFLGENIGLDFQTIKSYVYVKVRLIFDPPQSGPAIQSFERMADQLEWRLNVQVDSEVYYG